MLRTGDELMLVSSPLPLSSSTLWVMVQSWMLSPIGVRGCGSDMGKRGGCRAAARARSEVLRKLLLPCSGCPCSRNWMRLLRLTKRVLEYLIHLSALWLARSVMGHSHFPDSSSSVLTSARKTHSDGPRERTKLCNIAYSVNEVIDSEDGSLHISI